VKAQLIVLFAAAGIFAIGSPVWAQNWTGSNSTNWNDISNWGYYFPAGGSVTVNTNSPNIATITANSLYQPGQIEVNGGAQIDHIAGLLSSSNDNYVVIGAYGQAGAYNLANTSSATPGLFTGYDAGSGSLTVEGNGVLNVGGVWIQYWVSTGGTGTFNMNTTGVLTLQNNSGWPNAAMVVGARGGTGVFNLDNGTITAPNQGIWIGAASSDGVAGTGTLNMSGGVINAPSMSIGNGGGSGLVNIAGGTVNLSGDANFGDGGTGASAASAGTLNMSGGVLNVAGNLKFGAANGWFDGTANGTGEMNLTGGTINAHYVGFANNPQWNGDHSSGTGTIGAGALLNSKTWVDVGNLGNGTAQLTINGTLNVNTANAGGGLSVADGENVQATVTINPGATVRIENNGQIATSTNTTYAYPSGVINQNGGSVTFYSDAGTTVGGTGFLNMQSQASGGNYTYNLNGGTLQVPQVGEGSGGWGSTSFNFNGGLLKATGNQSAFIANLSNVRIQSGGAIIDDSGYSIGIGQNLVEDSGSTGGGLTKRGGGMLTLTGNNTYTGGTTVNGGTLNINADAALGAAPFSPATNVTFTHNGTLQFGANNVSLNANRNIAMNSGVTLTLDNNNNGQTAIGGSITGNGSVVLLGNGVMTLSGSSNYTGTTTVNIGTLNLASGSLGATAVSIGPNGALAASGTASIAGSVTTTGAGAAINLQNGTIDTLNVNSLHLATGSVFGFDLGSAAGNSDLIAVNGAVSLTALSAGTVNISASTIQSGDYTLLTSVGGGLTPGGGDFTLGTHPAIHGFENFNHTTAHALVLTVSANPFVPTAYWTGAASRTTGDAANNWGAGTSTSNWSTDPAGTTDALQVPGPITSVMLTAANAVPGAGGVLTTQLNADYSIQGLTVAVPATTGSAQVTSTVINPNGYTLTLGGSGLTLDAASLASATIGSGSILLSTTSPSWANNNPSLGLTVNANIAPQANLGPTTLTFSGIDVGGIALSGSLRDSAFSPLSLVFNQAGVTQLKGANTFTGGVTISSGTVQLGNAAALNAASPNAVLFSSALSYGIGDLQLNGNSVTVSALNANDYTVTATVENGAAGPATLTVSNTGSSNYNGVLQDGGSGGLALTKSGTGTLRLTGYGNTYTGGTNLNGGVLNFVYGTVPISSSNINFHGGTLQWANGNAEDVSPGIAPIAAGQVAIFDTNGNYYPITFASSLSGSGGLTKTGGGTLIFLNSNSYSGVTTVNGGTLQIDNGGSIATPGLGSIVISSGGNVALDRSDSYVLGNSFSGAGTLYQMGSGTATLAGNSTGVGITVNNGALTLAGNNAGLGSLVVTGAGVLTIAGSTTATQSLNVATQNGDSALVNILPGSSFTSTGLAVGSASGGTGTINMSGGTVNEVNGMSVGAAVGAVGIMNMSGGVVNVPNWLLIGGIYPGGQVSGIFNISGGLVHVSGGGNVSLGTFQGNAGTLSVSGGTVQSDNSIYVGDGDGTGMMTVSGGLVIANSGVLLGRYNYSASDSSGIVNLQGGRLRTSGVALTGGTGAFNFSGGTLENAVGANLSVTMPVNLSGPGIVDIDNGQTGAFTSAAPIDGSGSLYKLGGGTLTLSGSGTYTGGTNVFAGALIVTSPNGIKDGSNLFVGSPGSFFAPPVPSFAGGSSAVPAAPAIAPVPEPGTLALLTAGAAATLAALWRRKRRGLNCNN